MSEQFAWYDRREFEGIPKNQLLRLVAKTTTPTDHTKDKTIPVEERKIRIYPAEELRMAARSLIQRPVLINHVGEGIGFVLDAEWNELNQEVECVVQVPTRIVEAFNQHKFTNCSVGVNARNEIVNDTDITYSGLWFNEVSLITISDEFHAGDPNAKITAFESTIEFIGAIESVPAIKLKEIIVKRGDQYCVLHCHGDKAGQVIKCFPSKDQAIAMHQAIMAHKKKESVDAPKPAEVPAVAEKPVQEPVKPVEIPKVPEKPVEIPEIHSPSVVPQKPIVPDPKQDLPVTDAEIEEFTKKIREHPELLRKVTDLEATVNTAQTLIKELKGKQDGEIKKAISAEKERIIKKIEEAIPSVLVQRQGSIPFNRLVIEIKRKILEL